MNKEQRVSVKEALGIKDMSDEYMEELLGDSFKWIKENESKVGSVTRGFLKEYYPSMLVMIDNLPPQLDQGVDALSLLLFQIGYMKGAQAGEERGARKLKDEKAAANIAARRQDRLLNEVAQILRVRGYEVTKKEDQCQA